MSTDTKRLHLRFSMARPEQRQAYEIISSIPAGQRMDFLCGLVARHQQYSDLETLIYNTIKKALQEYQPSLPLQEQPETGEIPSDILGFLTNL